MLDFKKRSDRRLSGNRTEMKRITRVMEFSPVSINRAEMAINDCPFSYLTTKEPMRFHNPLRWTTM